MNAYAAVEDHEAERREAIRYPVVASGRMTWTDAPGDDRSASIRTENVSERGVLLECLSTTEISPYRLVSLSLSARARAREELLPNALRHPEVQAAIYRVETPDDPHQTTLRACVCSCHQNSPAECRGPDCSRLIAARAPAPRG